MIKLGNIPNKPLQAYALVTFISGFASLFAWSFGLIVGGISAKFVAMGCEKKKLKIHYPLLVASAYSGYVIWHMGYSSSAALFVASEGHSLVSKIGIIPVTETIFTTFNITVALLTLITITVICPLMRPSRDKDIIEIDTNLLNSNKKQKENVTVEIKSFAQVIENSKYLSIFTGLSLIGYIFIIYLEKGFYLDLNIVSWTFLSIGLILANSPIHYVKLINNAVNRAPIVLKVI